MIPLYADGTVYYIDRTEDEHEHSKRRALGTHVWRRSDNKDAMREECIGPSAYSKGQGKPVRVWGMLSCGGIHIHVLPEGETLDSTVYAEIVEDFYDDWAGNCEHLVCDFERCIRSPEAVQALERTQLKLVEGYPRCSQDFNAMENAWDLLKKRLDVTMPTKLEGREEFVQRLGAAVKWVNRNKKDQLWDLSTNQKKRAQECLAKDPPGGRTQW